MPFVILGLSVLVFVLLVVCADLGCFLARSVRNNRRQKAEIADLRSQLERATEANSGLQGIIDQVPSDIYWEILERMRDPEGEEEELDTPDEEEFERELSPRHPKDCECYDCERAFGNLVALDQAAATGDWSNL